MQKGDSITSITSLTRPSRVSLSQLFTKDGYEEELPLDVKRFAGIVPETMSSGSFLSGMMSTMLGTGLVCLPAALKETGLVCGLGLLAIMAVLNWLGATALAESARASEKFTYEGVGDSAFSQRWIRMVCIDGPMILNLVMGVCIYIIMGVSLTNGIIAPARYNIDNSKVTDLILLVAIASLIALLSLIRSHNTLSFANTLSFGAYVIIAVIVVGMSFLFKTPGLYAELKPTSKPYAGSLLGVTFLTGFLVYFSVGYFPYRVFLDSTPSNILY